MSTNVTFNGTSYIVPAIADASWGTNTANYLIAISTGCLQKTGGSFTLSTADVDFGATYGLKAVYFKSKTVNIASAGVVALAKTDTIGWRNNANGADLALGIDGSDNLTFNSIVIVNSSGTQTLTNKLLSDSTVKFANVSDATKLLMFSLGGATTAQTMTIISSHTTARSLTLPDATDTLVGKATTDTLTNKTLTSPTMTTPTLGVATATSINKMAITAPATSSTLAVADGKTFTASNTLTLTGTDTNSFAFPSGSSTVMTLASADTITGVKTFGDGKVVLSGASSGASTLKAPAAASTYVHTLPAATDTLVGLTFQQTATNKLLSDSTVKFANVSDATKLALFSLGGATTAKTLTLISSHTNDRSITFPDATDTLMGKATTDTMTNKTATLLSISSGSYIDMLVQAAIRFNDDSGGDYIALQAPTGVTTHTLKLPAAQGSASTVLTNDGSGNLSWGAALTTALTQYNTFIGNSSNIATATNTNLIGDIFASTLSQTYAVTSAAPGVFTVTTAPATGSTAYVTVTQNGFTANTRYYVTNVSSTTFKLATTFANALAGTNITSSGTTAGTIISGGLQLATTGLYAAGVIAGADGAAATPQYTFASDPNTGVYSGGGDNLAFSTNGTYRGSFSAAGYFLINTASQTARFAVTDTDTSSQATAFIQNSNATASSATIVTKMVLSGGGTMTNALFCRFDDQDGAIGSISAASGTTVAFNTSSDKRLKVIDKYGFNALDIISKMNPVKYKWKEDPNSLDEYGFIAQELYEALPHVVKVGSSDDNDFKYNPWSVDYGKITGVLCKAIQELNQQIIELKAKIGA